MTSIIGLVYPAPGGNDFTTDGNSSGRSPGQTRTYGALTHYSSYFWGLSNIGAAMDGFIDSPDELLDFSTISEDGLTATWTGQTQAPDFGGPVYVQLTVSIIAATSGTAHWVSATSQGLAGGPEELVDVDESIGSFQVRVAFTASTESSNSGFQAFLDVYDAITTSDGGARTSTSGSFFALALDRTQTLTSSAETFTASSYDNWSVTGLAGNDTITTFDGNDSLNGGSGIDSMSGGAGNDSYYVDNAEDTIVEASSAGIDTVFSTVSWIAGQNIENITLVGNKTAIDATGNDLNNILTGNGGANRLDGGAGADTMIGGGRNDTYIVDNVGDVITEIGGQGLVDLVLSSVTYTLSGNVENLTLSGTDNIDANGNSGNNTLIGNSGNNLVNGKTGIDKMYGGLGDDTYGFDNIDDRIYEVWGEGIDTVKASVSYNALGQSIENIILTLSAAIDATGQGLDNTITGNNAANTLDGGSGNDTLNGMRGADILIGGGGADVFLFLANCGSDTISDFHPSQNDTVNINAFSHGVVNGGGVTITQDGDNAVIHLGGSNEVTVLNTLATNSAFLNHIVW